MSRPDPIEQIGWTIEAHIYLAIKIVRMQPSIIAGTTAYQALAASLAAACLTALGLRPDHECHRDLAEILGVAPGPDVRERLASVLREIGRGGTEGHPDLDVKPLIGGLGS